MGAGGTARAVIYALIKLKFKTINIWNRNKDRAVKLVQDLEIDVLGSLENLQNVLNFYLV